MMSPKPTSGQVRAHIRTANQQRTTGASKPSRTPIQKNLLLNASCRWWAVFNSVANSGSFRNPFNSGSVCEIRITKESAFNAATQDPKSPQSHFQEG